jgi:hypothetical protein
VALVECGYVNIFDAGLHGLGCVLSESVCKERQRVVTVATACHGESLSKKRQRIVAVQGRDTTTELDSGRASLRVEHEPIAPEHR